MKPESRTKNEDSSPPVLSYASAPVCDRKPIRAVFAEIASVCFGALGLLVLCLVIPDLYHVFMKGNRVDFAGDLFQMLLMLLIGATCFWAALRWSKSARQIAKQQISKPDSVGERSGDIDKKT